MVGQQPGANTGFTDDIVTKAMDILEKPARGAGAEAAIKAAKLTAENPVQAGKVIESRLAFAALPGYNAQAAEVSKERTARDLEGLSVALAASKGEKRDQLIRRVVSIGRAAEKIGHEPGADQDYIKDVVSKAQKILQGLAER